MRLGIRKRVEALETAVEQMSCPHDEVVYEQTTCSSFLRGTWREPIVEVCCECGKTLRTFDSERKYLRAVQEYHATKSARAAELIVEIDSKEA